METVGLIVLATVAVSAVSLIGILALSLNERLLNRALVILIALAAGALIGDSVIHLIPEAFEGIGDERSFGLAVISGIVLFFVLERYLRWHHAHHGSEEEHEGHERYEEGPHNPTAHLAPLVIVADGLHNFIDGIAIAASFVVSVPLGVATTVAIFLHEIPQEIADFALLIHAGYSRAKAVLFNFLSGLTAIIGALAFLLISDSLEGATFFATALTAGAFIYIAIADIVPELHKERHAGKIALQLLGLLGGIALMFAMTFFE